MAEEDQDNLVDKYLELTGQDFKYLASGAMQYGDDFIMKELVPKALEEHKKIIWIEAPVDGEDLGLLEYELQPI